MRKLVHLSITGTVQGVGYRAFVISNGLALHLEGWTRNRRDGTVEAVAAGKAGNVDALIEKCRKGPRLAHVTGIEITQATEDMLSMRNPGEQFSQLDTL